MGQSLGMSGMCDQHPHYAHLFVPGGGVEDLTATITRLFPTRVRAKDHQWFHDTSMGLVSFTLQKSQQSMWVSQQDRVSYSQVDSIPCTALAIIKMKAVRYQQVGKRPPKCLQCKGIPHTPLQSMRTKTRKYKINTEVHE